MRKAILILLVLFLLGCYRVTDVSKREIGGHIYIIAETGYGVSIIHAEDCPNSEHYEK